MGKIIHASEHQQPPAKRYKKWKDEAQKAAVKSTFSKVLTSIFGGAAKFFLNANQLHAPTTQLDIKWVEQTAADAFKEQARAIQIRDSIKEYNELVKRYGPYGVGW